MGEKETFPDERYDHGASRAHPQSHAREEVRPCRTRARGKLFLFVFRSVLLLLQTNARD